MASELSGEEVCSRTVVDTTSPDVCSICFEDVLQNGVARARATLPCNHKFHFDCLGTFFNFNGGRMVCPNCRREAVGEWLFPVHSQPPVGETPIEVLEYLAAQTETALEPDWPISGLPHQVSPLNSEHSAGVNPLSGMNLLAYIQNVLRGSEAPGSVNLYGIDSQGFIPRPNFAPRGNTIGPVRSISDNLNGSEHSAGMNSLNGMSLTEYLQNVTGDSQAPGSVTLYDIDRQGFMPRPNFAPRGNTIGPVGSISGNLNGSVAVSGISIPQTAPISWANNSLMQQQVNLNLPVSTGVRRASPASIQDFEYEAWVNSQPITDSTRRILLDLGRDGNPFPPRSNRRGGAHGQRSGRGGRSSRGRRGGNPPSS